MTGFPKLDVFLENFRRGGGGISDPKNYIADFVGFKAVYFGEKKKRNIISKKGGRGGGVIVNPKNVIANLSIPYWIFWKKRNVISKKRTGGGGSRPVGRFPKKFPFLSRLSSLGSQIEFHSLKYAVGRICKINPSANSRADLSCDLSGGVCFQFAEA